MNCIPNVPVQIANRPNITMGFLQMESTTNVTPLVARRPNVTSEASLTAQTLP